ncbi:toll/interleukin-1 receptor domain-containing protein [Methylotuvimicrobium sp. KM2]|uniref:toll/interleukin-1 receptor domain-containing protein n=1 Tax=Methylotuvimicrobium sp. KM2 TaxID=3133976 RepID=UPI00310169BC
MFITLQLPFVDLRRFLQYPPEFVPVRFLDQEPSRDDFEKIAKENYVRCFGSFQLRGFFPKFKQASNTECENEKILPPDEEQWGSLLNLWQDEYLYASTRKGLRFDRLEKQELLGGKLRYPRAKIRALRFSPFKPSHSLWSPCMRIEIGILYSVPSSITGDELVDALSEFVKLKVKVPTYKRDGAGRNAKIEGPIFQNKPLVEQQEALARLIVNGTTAQHVLRVHEKMVSSGSPLLTVHYFPDELSSLPKSFNSLPKRLTRNVGIGYHSLKEPRIGAWLFELPYDGMKKKTASKKREIIRNNTIAIMRYWSELQAVIALRSSVLKGDFSFSLKENDQLNNYVNKATKFLLSKDWHGGQLDIIRNIMRAHQLALPEDKQADINDSLRHFKRQIAIKLENISAASPPKVFVCYSHVDSQFLSVIQSAFSPFLKEEMVSYFDDTYISPSDEWEARIRYAIKNASVVVLMVSEHFFSSDYIQIIEMSNIIDLHKRQKLKIIPVLVKGAVPEKGYLSNIQFVNPKHPLFTASQEDIQEIMKSLVKEVFYDSNRDKFNNIE